MGILDRITARAVTAAQGVVARVMAPADAARARELERLERLARGLQYDAAGLKAPWDKTPVGTRPAPMREQRPSAQYDLPALLVERPTSLLFGEGHFPVVVLDPAEKGGDAAETNAWLARVVDEGNLEAVALTWSRQTVVRGSGCLTWCVCDGEFEFAAHKTEQLTPTFHPRRARCLVALEKRYEFVKRVARVEGGRAVEVDETWLHRETWDAQRHVVYQDQPKPKDPSTPLTWVEAEGGVAVHGLGFVPAVWVKAKDDGEAATWDGESILAGVEDLFASIDRTLSQKDRAVFFNQDPLVYFFGLTKETAGNLHIGGGNTLSLPKKTDGGDVAITEYTGSGQAAAEEHIQAQRGRVLETKRVVSLDPDKLLAAARSGKALEILHKPTLDLVGEYRSPFGRALAELLGQVVRAAREGTLQALGELASAPPATIPAGRVRVQWGAYFDPTPDDLQVLASVARNLADAGLCDRETLVRWCAQRFGWKDPDAILARLEAEEARARAALEPRDGAPKGRDGDGAKPADGAPKGEARADDDDDTDDGAKPAVIDATTGAATPADPKAKDPSTALNGAQVASLLDIVEKVSNRAIPRASGVAMIAASFPLTPAEAEAVMGEVGKSFFAAPPAPPPGRAGAPPPAVSPPDEPPPAADR